MNKHVNAMLLIASFSIAAYSPAYADDSCLIGSWQSEEENYVATGEMRQMFGLELSASGGFTIEFVAPYQARLIYQDYVIVRTMVRSTHTMTMEMTFNGTIEGGFSVYEEKGTVSIEADGEVHASVRQKRPNTGWIPIGEVEERAPHRQDGFTFECSGDELLLSKAEHGEFGADYHGRFVRAD